MGPFQGEYGPASPQTCQRRLVSRAGRAAMGWNGVALGGVAVVGWGGEVQGVHPGGEGRGDADRAVLDDHAL